MKLTRTGLNPHEIALRESLFHVANGYLGVRASFEEGVPAHIRSIRGAYINAFYDTHPIQYAEKLYGFPQQAETIVNVPDMQGVTLLLGEERFSPFAGTLLAFTQTLDMETGQYTRHLVWRSPQGRETDIVFGRMASFTQKELLIIQITVTPLNWSGRLQALSEQRSDVTNDGDPNDPRKAAEKKQMLQTIASGVQDGCMYLECETLHSGLHVACAAVHSHSDELDITYHSTLTCNTAILQGTVSEGRSVSFGKWCVYADSIRHASPLAEAQKLAYTCSAEPLATWQQRQQHFLHTFWAASRVEVAGPASLQSAIDFAVYALLQSTGQDSVSSIPAKGLSGEGYEGHYFWDTEIYMFPFFLLTQPQMARRLLDFRYKTLDAARRQARILGHEAGALYPWRTIVGSECSSYFPSGSAQYHINSDIAHAVITYYHMTGDLDYIKEKGAEILIETARLWLSVGHWHEGQFRIDGVTGPDEYTCLVNNNYYTNLSVKFHLEGTLLLCRRLQETYPSLSLSDQYGLTDAEMQAFENVSRHIYLPYDETLGICAQDDSFLQKRKMDLHKLSPSDFPLLLHFHPLYFYRQQVCKQADAVLAHFLYEDGLDDSVIRRTYEYYETITTHDSSLSPCVFSMMAARIGDAEKAYRYYMHSVYLDLENKQHNTDDGIHAANMGGAYMGIVFGFAGLRIRPDGLCFRPCIPAQIERYAFPLRYSGHNLHISVTKTHITLQSDTDDPLSIRVYNAAYAVGKQPVTIPLV